VFKRFFPIALICAYPITVHASLLLGMPGLQVVAILFFLLGIFGKPLIHKQLWPWLIFIAMIIVILALYYFSLVMYLLYLPPIIMPLGLFIYFGLTLLPGQEPLITGIAKSVRGTLGLAMEKYTRTLTQVWCGVFVIMLLSAIVLPLINRPELWSWVTNVINYGVIGGLFVGEFILRKKLFPEYPHPHFFDYIRIVTQASNKPK